MASEVLTIRLRPETRKLLAGDAKRRGLGISEYVRRLAEAKALALEYAEVRNRGQTFMQRLRAEPEAMAEIESMLNQDPWEFLPPWEGPLPIAWSEKS